MTEHPAIPAPEEDRAPPHNFKAEQALLGAILVQNSCYDHVAAFLQPEYFADAVHGRIFDACSRRIEAGETVNPIVLKNRFDAEEELESYGGTQYLARLAGSSGSLLPRSIRDLGRVIHDNWLRRELMDLGVKLEEQASGDFDTPAVRQTEEADERLIELLQGQGETQARPLAQGLDKALERITKAASGTGNISGLSTGVQDLDNWLGGLHGSELIVLAGRPSMGKSTLAVNILINVAKSGSAAAMFSLEMPEDQVAMVALARETKISVNRQRRGDIDAADKQELEDAAARFRALPLHIDDSAGVALVTIRAQARYLKRRHNIGLVCIDHLQLMRAEARHGINRAQEIAEMTGGLKALAKDLDVPVLLLSQLSRANEAREDKRPQLSDLRESGAIEQDADVVMFLYREAYYLERKEPMFGNHDKHSNWEADMAAAKNKIEVLVAKHRQGPCGTIRLYYATETSEFSNLAKGGAVG